MGSVVCIMNENKKKFIILLVSFVLIISGIVTINISLSQKANSALNGIKVVANQTGIALSDSYPSCTINYDDQNNCWSKTVTFHAGYIASFQVTNATNTFDMGLFDSLGNELYGPTYNDNSKTIQYEVTRTGTYTLEVGSDSQIYFDVYAFETKETAKVVELNQIVSGTFADKTTTLTDKDGNLAGTSLDTYVDRVAFNGKKGQKITLSFVKSEDRNIVLHDSFGNDVTSN
ncbi:MAG: hypothetical protein LBM13_06170, partial [Candidatus Ancillula sp.]|nr:hypothetical protein [Candidatus Ancillula sp.]